MVEDEQAIILNNYIIYNSYLCSQSYYYAGISNTVIHLAA